MAIKHKIKFNTEVVNGLCPECNQDTVLVSLYQNFIDVHYVVMILDNI